MQPSASTPLPIHAHRPEILALVRQHPTTVICGETGCGKTTQLPQYLYPEYRRILITQPRRISAITLAERVAQEMGCTLGQEIGYSVRFEEKRSANSRVMFMTDGMAIRELMTGRMYDVFVLDEAHERSINTDVLMALLRARQRAGRDRFKIVIMSATIEADKFLHFFQSEAVVRVQGRTYPTHIYNVLEPVENYLQAAFNTVLQIHYTEPQGDILTFLTGEDQILTLSKKLGKSIQDHNIHNLDILMLYSALPHEYQHSIFTPGQEGRRRVILATNIAETSITVNGLRYVVDPGFMKIRVYDTVKNVDMLSVVPISKANAMQRTGRAGREAEGKCFRLYSKNDYDDLEQQVVPEILRSELSGPILQLKAIGVPYIRELEFMDQPPVETINNCLQLLRTLKCIDGNEVITAYGLQVSKIPLVPYLSSLLIQSHQQKCHALMLNVLSVLSIDNFFYLGKDSRNKNNNIVEVMKKYMPVVGGTHLHSDHLTKANILEEYVLSSNKKAFCKGNFVNKNNIKRAVQIREQLADYLKQIIEERGKKQFTNIGGKQKQEQKQQKFRLNNESISNWLRCMENGSPNNIAKLNKEGNYTIVASGQVASIHPQSLLFFTKPKPQFIVFYQVIRTTKLYLRDVTALTITK